MPCRVLFLSLWCCHVGDLACVQCFSWHMDQDGQARCRTYLTALQPRSRFQAVHQL
jgi:hypothetical protein